MALIPTLVGYVLFILAACHAWLDASQNRFQRMLMLLTLFGFGTLIELIGVTSGNYAYPRGLLINLGVVPMSVSLAWVGIIYSVMVIAERLELPWLCGRSEPVGNYGKHVAAGGCAHSDPP